MTKKLYVQPDWPTSIICWAFSLMILDTSLLLWLEITVFQVWTVLTFLLFIAVAVVQIRGRYVVLGEDILTVHTVIGFNSKRIKYDQIKEVTVLRTQVIIAGRYQTIKVLASKKVRQQLVDGIREHVPSIKITNNITNQY
ncbi:EbsA family protein [Ligilactobacillus sp. LYQ60]|uniref:EbsA family protein n=1 Tax=unclassified Ligilactobacillus TaxID=2767920 RepID=UPI003851CCF6